MLHGDSDIELAARCRASFGPEMCRQARHSLGAQPWAQARMKSSCAAFASAAAELNSRSLEEAVAKKKEGTDVAPVMDAVAQKKANRPAPSPQPVRPVAELLDKLQEAEATSESASDAQEEQPDPASKGTAVQEEEEEAQHKPALEEASSPIEVGGQAHDEGREVQKQVEEAKVQDDGQSPSAGNERVARIEVVSDMQTQQAHFSGGPKETAALTAADSAVKLFEETSIAMPHETSRLPAVIGSLVGAASLAGLTLLAASVGRDEGRRSGTHIQLDPEQEVE